MDSISEPIGYCRQDEEWWPNHWLVTMGIIVGSCMPPVSILLMSMMA